MMLNFYSSIAFDLLFLSNVLRVFIVGVGKEPPEDEE